MTACLIDGVSDSPLYGLPDFSKLAIKPNENRVEDLLSHKNVSIPQLRSHLTTQQLQYKKVHMYAPACSSRIIEQFFQRLSPKVEIECVRVTSSSICLDTPREDSRNIF